jgi:hypothetical protein
LERKEGRIISAVFRRKGRAIRSMKLTGHKTEALYRRYAITSAADLSEGVAKLAALHGAPIGSWTVVPITSGRNPGTIRRLNEARRFESVV